jgi:hypothetical protein
MKWLMLSAITPLTLLEQKLRAKDPDFIGLDDTIADQIKALIESFQKYLAEQSL